MRRAYQTRQTLKETSFISKSQMPLIKLGVGKSLPLIDAASRVPYSANSSAVAQFRTA